MSEREQIYRITNSGKVIPVGDLVRCNDCIHWDKGHTEECRNSDSVCFHNGLCKPDWFCADGKSKEGEQD